MTLKEICVTLTEFLHDNPGLLWFAMLIVVLDYSFTVYRFIKKVPCSKNTLVYLHHTDCGALSACNIVYYRKGKQFIVIPDFYYDDFCREADSIKESSNGRKFNTDTGTNTGTDTLSHSGSCVPGRLTSYFPGAF